MQISSRFTLAVHIFACIDTFQDEYKVTSDFRIFPKLVDFAP